MMSANFRWKRCGLSFCREPIYISCYVKVFAALKPTEQLMVSRGFVLHKGSPESCIFSAELAERVIRASSGKKIIDKKLECRLRVETGGPSRHIDLPKNGNFDA
jgi:hypothetical protein